MLQSQLIELGVDEVVEDAIPDPTRSGEPAFAGETTLEQAAKYPTTFVIGEDITAHASGEIVPLELKLVNELGSIHACVQFELSGCELFYDGKSYTDKCVALGTVDDINRALIDATVKVGDDVGDVKVKCSGNSGLIKVIPVINHAVPLEEPIIQDSMQEDESTSTVDTCDATEPGAKPVNTEVYGNIAHPAMFSHRLDCALEPERIANKALARYVKTVFNATSEELTASVTIPVTTIYSRKGSFGIWEEGGADTHFTGRAITATDANGSCIQACVSYSDSNVICGKHALLPIEVGCHIIMGAIDNGVCFITDYLVTSMPTEEDETHYAVGTCQHVYSSSDADEIWSLYEVGGLSNDQHDQPQTEETLTAVRTVLKAMLIEGLHMPIYAASYAKHKFFTHDYLVCLNDKQFMQKVTESVEPDLATAYQTIGMETGKLVDSFKQNGENSIVTVITSLNYYPRENPEESTVGVFLLVCVVNNAEKSSQPYFGTRVILHPGDSFKYIDSEYEIKWDEITSALAEAPNRCAVSTVRRILNAQAVVNTSEEIG